MAVSSARHESIFNQGFPYYCPDTVQHKARTLFRPRKAQEIWQMAARSERAMCHAQLVQLNHKASDTVKTLFIQLIAP